MKMLLSLAIIFSMATQLRWIAGYGGPAESFGLLLLAGAVINRDLNLPPLLVTGLLLTPAGFVIGGASSAIFSISTTLTLRDLLALIYAALLGIAAVSVLGRQANPARVFANALTGAVLFQLIPLALPMFGISTNPWMGEDEAPGLPFLTRYMGFSENPNQLGILICAYPVAVGFASFEKAGFIQKAWLTLGLLGTLGLAVLVDSNTVFLAYIVAAGVAISLWVIGWPRTRSGFLPQLARSSVGLLGVPVFVGAVALYASYSVGKTGEMDANGRLQRWKYALEGVNRSAMLGVGPGAQAGETGPFQGTEAHNVLLDLALQGGLLSLVGYLLIVWVVAKAALVSRNRWLVCVVVAILTEQMAHYTLRQPIGWMYLLLPLVALPDRGHVETA